MNGRRAKLLRKSIEGNPLAKDGQYVGRVHEKENQQGKKYHRMTAYATGARRVYRIMKSIHRKQNPDVSVGINPIAQPEAPREV